MSRIHTHFMIVLLISCAALAGCKHSGQLGGGSGGSGSAPVVLAMTDTPPTNVSILSAEVTLTGATLNPGSVTLFSGTTTIELTRLQTDIAYLATTKVTPGSYTSLALTFSNPMLTIENDTSSPLATGGTNPSCAVGAICTIQSVATILSTTMTLSPAMSVSASSGAGLLVDVSLNSLLSATLGADFTNGTTVSQFTPAGTGAPPVGAEDVVGHITSVDMTLKTFMLQNVTGVVSLTVDNTTAFLNFPAGTCGTPSIGCVAAGQILSVDIGNGANGTAVARNVLFEDADSSKAEVEGIVTGFDTGMRTISIVTLTESETATTTGLNIGATATVTYTGTTPFDLDFAHADSMLVDTTGFLFNAPADLIVGQQVQVRRTSSSSGTSITADRVRLRSSRVTGTIQSGTTSLFQLAGLPSLLRANPTIQVHVQTPPTICTGTISSCSVLAVPGTKSVSVRGPLFANSGSPTLITSKVLQH